MEKLFKQILDILRKVITLALYFLCLGIIVQLLTDDKILGWDPVGNIQDAGGRSGGANLDLRSRGRARKHWSLVTSGGW